MNWLFRFSLGPKSLSLHRQLVVWILLPQLVLWLAGGVATYQLAVRYVNQGADATLSQATRALARQVKPIGSGLMIDFPRAAQDVLEADPHDRLLYTVSTPPGKFILGNSNIPLPPAGMRPPSAEPYYYDGEIVQASEPGHAHAAKPTRVRIAALYLPYNAASGRQQWMLVQVARSTAARQSLLKSIWIDTLLPLSGLILLMTVIVWAGTGIGLAPLHRVRSEVEGRSPFDLAPLQIDAAPQEVRALVSALNELLASVQHNVDAQKRFIADAAHQLRTPLAGLKSQTELALHDTDDPQLVARLQMVHQSALRGAHLINQLLMLARADPEAAQVQDMTPLHLPRFVEDVVAALVPRALKAGIDLGVADGGESNDRPHVNVLAYPMLLREALSNVIENSIEYAGRGSEVTVSVAAAGDEAHITISDTGPGIAAEDRARVFERFVRATHGGHGCGLGLSIVKEIMTRHGGSVSLEPALPHGLRVEMRLPLSPAH